MNKSIQETGESNSRNLYFSLKDLDGVIGTSTQKIDGQICLVVLIMQNSEELIKQIPKEYMGYKVKTQATGEFFIQNQ